MSHRDELALLRAVRESPKDPLPLCAYADFLEERGDSRAEWVRLGRALVEMPGNAPQRPASLARRDELLSRHRDEWLAPLESLAGYDDTATTPLLEAFASLNKCLDHLDRFAAVPALGGVRVDHFGPLDHELLGLVDPEHAAVAAGLLASFEIDHLDEDGLRALIDFPPASRLRTLRVNRLADLDEPAVRWLAEAPFAPYLEELCLPGWNGEGWAGLAALLDTGRLSSLASLDLSRDHERNGADLLGLFLSANAASPGCVLWPWDAETRTLSDQIETAWAKRPGLLDLDAVIRDWDPVGLLAALGDMPAAAHVRAIRLRGNSIHDHWAVLVALDEGPFFSVDEVDMGSHYGEPDSLNRCISGTMEKPRRPVPRVAASLKEIIVPWEDDGYDVLLPFPDKYRQRLKGDLPRTLVRVESMMTGEVT